MLNRMAPDHTTHCCDLHCRRRLVEIVARRLLIILRANSLADA